MDSRKGQNPERRQNVPPNEPEIASPADHIDEDCGGFLQEMLDLIDASHPNFLSSLTATDREALLAMQRECQEEMAREFQRIAEARHAYLRGFRSGVDRLMGSLSNDLAAFCETVTQPMTEKQQSLIDNCGETLDLEEQQRRQKLLNEGDAALMCRRDIAEEPCQTAIVNEERHQNNEPNFVSNTTFIFWDPLRIVEFDCECRPLTWCFDVTSDGLRQDIRDMSTAFHGLPLLWRTHEERLVGEEVVLSPDPRLPASCLAAYQENC